MHKYLRLQVNEYIEQKQWTQTQNYIEITNKLLYEKKNTLYSI